MKETINTVLDQMPEEEFFGILSWAAIKALITMFLLFCTGYFLIPKVAEGNSTFFAITFVATMLVFSYVFKMDYHDLWSIGWYLLGSFLYSVMTYFFGEIIYIGLLAVGILVVVMFIAGDGILTGGYTYRDLKKWVAEKNKQKEKMPNLSDIPTSVNP